MPKFKNDRFIPKRISLSEEEDILSVKALLLKKIRYISNQPYKILDAPDVVFQNYTYIMDWSPDNKLAIVINNIIYFWNINGIIKHFKIILDELDYIISVKWNKSSNLLAFAGNHYIKLYDFEKNKVISKIKIDFRITNISWKNDYQFSSGSYESIIYNFNYTNGVISQLKSINNKHIGEKTFVKWNNSNILTTYSKNNCHIINMKKTKLDVNRVVDCFCWNSKKPKLFAIGVQDFIELYDITNNSYNEKIQTNAKLIDIYWNKYNEIISINENNDICLWDTKNKYLLKRINTCNLEFICSCFDTEENILISLNSEKISFWKL